MLDNELQAMHDTHIQHKELKEAAHINKIISELKDKRDL